MYFSHASLNRIEVCIVTVGNYLILIILILKAKTLQCHLKCSVRKKHSKIYDVGSRGMRQRDQNSRSCFVVECIHIKLILTILRHLLIHIRISGKELCFPSAISRYFGFILSNLIFEKNTKMKHQHSNILEKDIQNLNSVRFLMYVHDSVVARKTKLYDATITAAVTVVGDDLLQHCLHTPLVFGLGTAS